MLSNVSSLPQNPFLPQRIDQINVREFRARYLPYPQFFDIVHIWWEAADDRNNKNVTDTIQCSLRYRDIVIWFLLRES